MEEKNISNDKFFHFRYFRNTVSLTFVPKKIDLLIYWYKQNILRTRNERKAETDQLMNFST